jgi:hypothetical protein
LNAPLVPSLTTTTTRFLLPPIPATCKSFPRLVRNR